MKSLLNFFMFMTISLTLVEIPILHAAETGMISTSEVVSNMKRTLQQEKIGEFLGREEVKKQLVEFGLSGEEATLRLAGLSDSEIQQISQEIEGSTAGGDVIVISLTTILIVVVILLLLRRI